VVVDPIAASGLTPLKDFAATIAASKHSYVSRAITPAQWMAAWEGEDRTVAILSTHQGKTRQHPWLLIVGDGEPIAHNLSEIISVAQECAGEKILRITLPRSVGTRLNAPKTSAWDWMEIGRPPPPFFPEIAVQELEIGRDDDEITAFLHRSSPTASTLPGDPELISWHGIREHGELVSVGGAVRWRSGIAVLVSIATFLEHRGRGYGQAVTASLVRSIMSGGDDVVALGMYASNDSARKTYERVGFRVVEEFMSCGFD
jgi:GNAT superfamily N-acetyltransferase